MYKRISEALYQVVIYRWLLPKRIKRYADRQLAIYRNDKFLEELKLRHKQI